MRSLRGNPWLIAFIGLFILMITNGLTATAISVFDESLINEFGWSRGDISVGWVVANLGSHHRNLAWYEVKAQEDVWGENPDAGLGVRYPASPEEGELR